MRVKVFPMIGAQWVGVAWVEFVTILYHLNNVRALSPIYWLTFIFR